MLKPYSWDDAVLDLIELQVAGENAKHRGTRKGNLRAFLKAQRDAQAADAALDTAQAPAPAAGAGQGQPATAGQPATGGGAPA
jgi:hypothetical protein